MVFIMGKKKNKIAAWKQKRNAKLEKDQKNIWEIRGSLISAVLFLVLFLFIGKSQLRTIFFYETVNFKKTNGVVVKSFRSRHTGKAGSYRYTSYAANISYKFIVNNQTYISDSFQLDAHTQEFSSSSEADNLLSNYQIGTKVDVFYEEGNPSLSFIKIDGRFYALFFYIVLVILFLFSLLRALFLYKNTDEVNRRKIFSIK